jgi:hypothetical protein
MFPFFKGIDSIRVVLSAPVERPRGHQACFAAHVNMSSVIAFDAGVNCAFFHAFPCTFTLLSFALDPLFRPSASCVANGIIIIFLFREPAQLFLFFRLHWPSMIHNASWLFFRSWVRIALPTVWSAQNFHGMPKLHPPSAVFHKPLLNPCSTFHFSRYQSQPALDFASRLAFLSLLKCRAYVECLTFLWYDKNFKEQTFGVPSIPLLRKKICREMTQMQK